MAQFKTGGLVTYVGDNAALMGRVGVVERIDWDANEIAVDFGRTDEPILRCLAHNLLAADMNTSRAAA